jgi:uncharacterized protein
MTHFRHLTPEEEFFARENLAKVKKLAAKKREKLDKEEREKLKKLHWMHCAKCGCEMQEILFRGITVNRCLNCGGVYLDHAEFEKLAGKESGFFPSILSLFQY